MRGISCDRYILSFSLNENVVPNSEHCPLDLGGKFGESYLHKGYRLDETRFAPGYMFCAQAKADIARYFCAVFIAPFVNDTHCSYKAVRPIVSPAFELDSLRDENSAT